jgi:hypothetical protein
VPAVEKYFDFVGGRLLLNFVEEIGGFFPSHHSGMSVQLPV